jgi:hypothetical protein
MSGLHPTDLLNNSHQASSFITIHNNTAEY